MFKKIMLIAVFVLVIGALLVVAFWDDITAPRLDTATKQLISEACAKRGIGPVNWDAKDMTSGSVRYYGNFEGYEVLLLCPENCEQQGVYYLRIAYPSPVVYVSVDGCKLYAYKDGSINEVSELYEDGTFNYDTLMRIADKHEKFNNPNVNEGHIFVE